MNHLILDRLQSTFSSFIERQPRLPSLAPAFFIEDQVREEKDFTFQPVTERAPFQEFWMVYQSSNGVLGYIQNIALCQDRVVRLWCLTSLVRKLVLTLTFDLDNPTGPTLAGGAFHDAHEALGETLPEMRLILDRIAHNEREESSPPVLRRLNMKRHAKALKKIQPYIVLKPTRAAAPSDQPGNGSPKCAHNRRGHFRTLASGKQVWVKQCSIHGGSIAPKDYRLNVGEVRQ